MTLQKNNSQNSNENRNTCENEEEIVNVADVCSYTYEGSREQIRGNTGKRNKYSTPPILY